MFKCIAEGFKKRHLKKMVVKDERVLSFYNLDTAKKCIVFWVTDDVPVFSVNRVREALAKHMDVCLLAFIRQPKLNSEQIQDAIYLDSSGISYQRTSIFTYSADNTSFFIDTCHSFCQCFVPLSNFVSLLYLKKVNPSVTLLHKNLP